MRRALLAALLAGCACPGSSIVVRAETDIALCAEVADTEAARQLGLRGRERLLADEALHLPFPVEDRICIVNDGVSFSIDVLYAAADGRVVAVERGVPAGDGTPRCHEPVMDVVEAAAGALAGASPGDALILNP